MTELLEREQAHVIHAPLIEIEPPESYTSLDEAIVRLEATRLVIFSSTNGVESFFQRLLSLGKDARSLANATVAAVGRATADALRSYGVIADLVPDRFHSAALLPLISGDLTGKRVVVVRAEEGNDEFLAALRARGADVHLAVAYRTVLSTSETLRAALARGGVDAITFTSGSTVESFFTLIGDERSLIEGVVLVAIGPVTSDAIRRHGVEPAIEAAEASVDSLVESLAAYYA